MVPNVDRNIQQLLNKTNVNNSINLFFIVVLTARIPQIVHIIIIIYVFKLQMGFYPVAVVLQ
jgi:hypothetical protein